jgi:hypothetical protein
MQSALFKIPKKVGIKNQGKWAVSLIYGLNTSTQKLVHMCKKDRRAQSCLLDDFVSTSRLA